MPRLILIDGSGFIFRAYHAIQQPMTRSDGTPVKAVYGFLNMMFKLLDSHKAEHIAVIFDAGRQTFRNRIYPEYKAHRPPAPDDLIPQFPLVRRASEALGIPTIELVDYEADDIIATYTKEAREAGMDVVIVSSDKDLMQLIGDGVIMFDGMKQKDIGPDQVMEKFGVGPDRVRDVLALIGDTSDNIPGVPGIGPKTAAELVLQFGNLGGVLARAAEIKQNARRETILANGDNAKLSYELIGLCDTVPLPLRLADLVQTQHPDTLLAFLREMEFRSLTARMEQKFGASATPAAQAATHADYTLISDEAMLAQWCAKAKADGHLALSLALAADGGVTGLGLCIESGKAAYVPFGHMQEKPQAASQGSLFGDSDAPTERTLADGQLQAGRVYAALGGLLADPGVLAIGHNVKTILVKTSLDAAACEDVMLISYVLGAGKHNHGLAELAALHLDLTLPEMDSITGSGRARLGLADLTPAAVMEYAAREADATFRLWRKLKPELVAEKAVTLYETIERPLVDVTLRMERAGIKVDPAQLAHLSQDFGQRMVALEHEIYALAGGVEFNIGSPKQMGDILFGKLGLPGGRKNKTGSYGTGAEVLEELAEAGHELPARILDWRQLSKLKSTYTDALAQEIASDGRVHTSYALAATSTGRLSSSAPNLQNIPIRSEEGRKIRHAFIAEAGHSLISADYSQIELRLLADIADIAPLKEAFKNGQDIHAITASQMFGVPVAEVGGDLRRKAKTINFGIIYGISAHGLAVRLGIPRHEAATYIETYFRQYPGIQAYMERTKIFAREHGYVLTLFGRKCYINGIADKNPAMRAFSERAAINAPLQGTAADIIKRAMIAVDRLLVGTGSRMLLQVHDELVIETPSVDAEKIAADIRHTMERAAALSVPLTVDSSIGVSWGK